MANAKIENLLNLALDANADEREKSLQLGIGYSPKEQTWEVIVRFIRDGLERVRELLLAYGYEDWRPYVTKLDNSYAILVLPESIVTPYILITGPKLNPLCLNAKQVIHLPPEEEFSDKIATFSSVIALDYVINILYSFLFALHYDKNMNNRYNIAIAKYKKTKE